MHIKSCKLAYAYVEIHPCSNLCSGVLRKSSIADIGKAAVNPHGWNWRVQFVEQDVDPRWLQYLIDVISGRIPPIPAAMSLQHDLQDVLPATQPPRPLSTPGFPFPPTPAISIKPTTEPPIPVKFTPRYPAKNPAKRMCNPYRYNVMAPSRNSLVTFLRERR